MFWLCPGTKLANCFFATASACDMPAGGRRFVQRVDGYEATLVTGTPIFERGEHTGAMPGRLVRAGVNGRAQHSV